MDQGIGVVIYPVSDLAQAKTLYRTLLGVEPYVDEASYVGFRVRDQEIGLDPHGHRKGMTGPVGYWHTNDIQPHMLIGTMHARTVVSSPCSIDDRQAVAQAKFLHRT
jgi:catechol 2,3-dioxygenase-like lactoylglutathione lyase family enzyme